jgi:chlorophyll(ide) b reductase
MAAMASEATAVLGGKPDIWLHNAGAAQPENKPLVDTDPADIERVVLTNSLGTLITVRAAMREMAGSPRGGHIFLMDGAGADGMVTANFATYGYTKAGVPQLLGSLKREAKGTGLVIHALSPGMVITDLLLKKVSARVAALKSLVCADAPKNDALRCCCLPSRLQEVAKGTAWFFNVLAEMPATVAAWMVPRVRAVAKFPVAVGKEASYSTYSKMLTQTGAIARFLAAPMSSNRLIDTTTGVVKSPGYGCPAKTTIIAAASKSKSE